MSTKRIILISGYARSGKDSLATALLAEFAKANKEAAVTKFADGLKKALYIALCEVGLDHIDVFTEDTAEKALLRPLLVEFGKYCRAKDKDVFVNQTLKDVGALLASGKDAVMISDCRYLNEAHLVRRFGGERGINVERVSIARIGTEAANDEERQSIKELCLHDQCEEGWHFPEGDTDGIKAWAKRIAKPSMPYEIQTPPVASEAAKEAMRKATAAGPVHPWTAWAESEKAAFKDNMVGVTATVPEHLTGSIVVPGNELLEQVLNIKLALERMEARLKRLEVDRHGF